MEAFKAYIKQSRPEQWIKNLILFLPLFFGQAINVPSKLIHTIILFIGFCFLTSSIYVFNDLKDAKEDRLHPLKKNRPIAAGIIGTKNAIVMMLAFLVVSLVIICCFCNLQIITLTIIYILLSVAYTLYLKQIPIIDAAIIACGFIIRLISGAIIADITLSQWLIIMTFLLSLFLAFGKRRDDLNNFLNTGKISRKNVTQYSKEFLNVVIAFLASLIAVIYILYTISPEVTERTNQYLYFTVPFVITGLIRYLQIIVTGKSNCNPTDILLHDRMLQLTIICWLVLFTCLIY